VASARQIEFKSRGETAATTLHVLPSSVDSRVIPFDPTAQIIPPDTATELSVSVVGDSIALQVEPSALLNIVPASPTAITVIEGASATPRSAREVSEV
jgi:hypothetical protein